MSSDEQIAVTVNGELMLARKRTLEDGTVQYVNRFGLALEGAQPVQHEGVKAAPAVKATPAKKRQTKARKKTGE